MGENFYAEISTEQLELLDADVLVWVVNTDTGASQIRQNPLYQSLDVAKQGRDLFLNNNDVAGPPTHSAPC